jgi:hypothetical protein
MNYIQHNTISSAAPQIQCVRRMLDRTQDCFDFGNEREMLSPLNCISHPHILAGKSHPLKISRDPCEAVYNYVQECIK